MEITQKTSLENDIAHTIVSHIQKANPSARDVDPFPLDESLLESGILDSFAIIELVTFIEQHWEIQVQEDELTREHFGGVSKMATFISKKRSS